jgi:hypothetical protein
VRYGFTVSRSFLQADNEIKTVTKDVIAKMSVVIVIKILEMLLLWLEDISLPPKSYYSKIYSWFSFHDRKFYFYLKWSITQLSHPVG